VLAFVNKRTSRSYASEPMLWYHCYFSKLVSLDTPNRVSLDSDVPPMTLLSNITRKLCWLFLTIDRLLKYDETLSQLVMHGVLGSWECLIYLVLAMALLHFSLVQTSSSECHQQQVW
jgi:hypothetical protein